MRKEIIQVDRQRGIARVTTLDERFYGREGKDPVTGLPTFEWRPSITHKAKFYPKGKGYENFLKKHGDEADMIRDLAGERGSKVHQAIERLNRGETVSMSDKFTNNMTGQAEELTPDEYYCVMTYGRWWDEEGSKEYDIIEAEDVIWPEVPKTAKNGDVHSEEGGILHFAATRDIRLRRKADGTTGTVDVKTSQDIYPSHIIQVSAIAEACGDSWQAILRVGYRRNKNGYKWDDVERRLDLLRAATTIHAYETSGEKPLQRDFPLSLSLGLPKKNNGTGITITTDNAPALIAAALDLPKDEPGPEERTIAEALANDEPELAESIKRKTRRASLNADTAKENHRDAA